MPMSKEHITHYNKVQIDDLPRDLRFFPCTNTNPSTLTSTQINTFNREGYLHGIHLFNKMQSNDLRIYFDALLKRVLAAGGDSYSINSAHLHYNRAYDILTHPDLVCYVKDILGENIIGWGAHFFCKMPHDPKTVSWHQDASYWPMSPSKTVTIWLAIDDADIDNACMRFIPRSHHHGHLTYHLSEADENNVLFQTVPKAETYGDPVDVELKAGQFSIHSDLLLHSSKANRSNRRRCGLTLRYCSSDVRALQGWHNKGILISGTDPEQHCANPPRPDQH